MSKLLAFIGGAVTYELVRALAHRNKTFAACLQRLGIAMDKAEERASMMFAMSIGPVRSRWNAEARRQYEQKKGKRHHSPKAVEDIEVVSIEDIEEAERSSYEEVE